MKGSFRMKRKVIVFSMFIVLFIADGCKKFLEEKPDKSISTPSNLSDLEGILDNYTIMNCQFPIAPEIGSDNYYLINSAWASSPERQRNYYVWQKTSNIGGDWTSPYRCIFNANLILETLPKLAVSASEQKKSDVLKGQALFVRAWYHFVLVQLFAPAYDVTSSETAAGIPLKLNTDYNEKSKRSSVAENYAQIIADVKKAIPLLPLSAKAKFLAAKPAAYALLARIFLQMSDFANAKEYANASLELDNTLMNYNDISITDAIPFKLFNEEVLFDCQTSNVAILGQNRAKVDSVLYAGYQNNDLRKVIFFNDNPDGSKAFKGNYTGLVNASVFSGLAKDEVLLTRAECLARLGELPSALDDLNKLLINRFKTGTFNPLTIQNTPKVLETVLAERRKELLFRNIRWGDLKRLNLNPATAKDLKRFVNNTIYELAPKGLRYTLQIDQNAILLSGMAQNP